MKTRYFRCWRCKGKMKPSDYEEEGLEIWSCEKCSWTVGIDEHGLYSKFED
jgi:ribosomal protein L37AE/L43A